MGFFDRPDDDVDEGVVDEPEFDPGTSPWIGGVVPLEIVLAQNDDAAVVLSSIVAHRESFDFTVTSYIHHSVKRPRRPFFHGPRWGGDDDEDPPAAMLRIGVAWPDGGRATNVDNWGRRWPGPDATEPLHGIEEGRGGGGDREYQTEYHAWPLPEDGQITFVVEWPAFDIAETSTPIDSSLFTDAAARSRPVWDDDEGRPPRISRQAMAVRFRAVSGTDAAGDDAVS